jgi:hypothetical protein
MGIETSKLINDNDNAVCTVGAFIIVQDSISIIFNKNDENRSKIIFRMMSVACLMELYKILNMLINKLEALE